MTQNNKKEEVSEMKATANATIAISDTHKADWEEEFDKKFPYHAVEYDESYKVKRQIFPEIKSFISQTLERERAGIIKMIEEMDTPDDDVACDYGSHIDKDFLLSKLREKE